MNLLAIDPGLDLVAGAHFSVGARPPATLEEAAGQLRHLVKGVTEPEDSLAQRCGDIAEWVQATALQLEIDEIAVEMPPVWHARRQKGRIPAAGVLESIGKLHASIGAIFAGAGVAGLPVIEVPAPKNTKAERRAAVNRMLERCGRKQLRNQDLIDAIWIGLITASSRRAA